MIVSWKWLQDYIVPGCDVETMAEKMTMSGFNLESIEQVGDDAAIDFEITSNRRDCLGLIGIAREIGVLFNQPLKLNSPSLKSATAKVEAAIVVENRATDLCPHYTARVIKGVKVGPSPSWMVERLATLGIKSINNIVDITNYVMMECGQPLHAFDLDQLKGGKIIIRRASSGEKMQSIKHTECQLTGEMCVIADAERPVAIAGVMGGLHTEITSQTTNVLLEVADFNPLSVRTTARKLALPSDSSYRFGRSVDRQQLEWASQRAAELVLELAGGELLAGVISIPEIPAYQPTAITLRWPQVLRILGVEIPVEQGVHILQALGIKLAGEVSTISMSFLPPSWRNDLEREIDLIEELARHYGYDKIPENVAPKVVTSSATPWQNSVNRIHQVLNACGFQEAYTLSFVTRQVFDLFHGSNHQATDNKATGLEATEPGKLREPLTVDHSTRRQENILRQSLVPSLLVSRRENEKRGTFDSELYEISRVFLDDSPTGEPYRLTMVSGKSVLELKGALEACCHKLQVWNSISFKVSDRREFSPGRGMEILVHGQICGFMGELKNELAGVIDLKETTTICELDLDLIVSSAQLIGQARALSPYQATVRDLNFVLDDEVSWDALSQVIQQAAGELLEELKFDSMFKGKQIAAGKKSYLTKLVYRATDRTLTSEEIDTSIKNVVARCQEQLNAELRA